MKIRQLQSGGSISDITPSQTVHIGIESLHYRPAIQEQENETPAPVEIFINEESYVVNNNDILEFENFINSSTITISASPNWPKNTFVTIAYND